MLRFDPADRPILSVAVLPDDSQLGARAHQLADQVLEEAAGERARRRLGHAGGRHQARDQHLPEPGGAWRRWASAPTRWWPRCAARTRSCRSARSARWQQERVVQIDARMRAAEDFGRSSCAPPRAGGRRSASARSPTSPTARRRSRAWPCYNGQRTLLLSVQKAQDENTIEVVDGLRKARGRAAAAAAARREARDRRDASRRSASRWRTCSAR